MKIGTIFPACPLHPRYRLPALAGSPLGFTSEEVTEIRDSSFRLVAGYLTLRYAISAGRSPDMLGRREFPVGGTGTISGRVFLDQNGNRQRDAGEPGAPGIIIILDGRQATRTDEGGFYVFDGVADGPHIITVNTDALPLPWSIQADNDPASTEPYVARVEVRVRANVTQDIAASR